MDINKKEPSIREWFQGRNVMVTGGTGFMGKILLAKLLTGCPEVGTIYVVIRDKKGVPAKTRLIQLFKVIIFNLYLIVSFFFINFIILHSY